MTEEGREFARTVLVFNGRAVGSSQEEGKAQATDLPGRTLVTSRLVLEVAVVNVVDDLALAAVHKRATFGLAHLKALVEALPTCQGDTHGLECTRVATKGWAFQKSYCASHAPPQTPDLPYAPAAEHIDRYVRAYYEEKKLPEGDP